MFINNKKLINIILGIIILFQCLTCAYFGFSRHHLFADEVYSYGLSNSKDRSFITYNDEDNYKWFSNDYFVDYMDYDESQPFTLEEVYINQANDVHPPIYYLLLHISCAIFKDTFYTPVPGVVVNLIIMIFIDIFLFKVANHYFKNPIYSLLTVILWGFSACGISNVIFIRMYLLQTLQLILLSYYHIKYINKKDKLNYKELFGLSLLVAFGGLTHYFFYFFAAALCFIYSLKFLFTKNYKEFFKYIFSYAFGLLLALIIFPPTINHIFGYRGKQALVPIARLFLSDEIVDKILISINANPQTKTDLNITNLLYNIKWLNESIYGNTGIIFLLLLLVVIYILIKKKIKLKDYYNEISLIISYIIFFVLATLLSLLTHQRYVYPFYPFASLIYIFVFVYVLDYFKVKYKEIIMSILVIIVCILSISISGISWMYEGKKRDVDYSVYSYYDCFILKSRDAWNNSYEMIDYLASFDEICILYNDELELIPKLLNERKTKDNVIIAFVDNKNNMEGMDEIMDEIYDLTPYNNSSIIYTFYDKMLVTLNNIEERDPNKFNGWKEENNKYYYYINDKKQGTNGRGEEIYDPSTDAWYWLDALDNGARVENKKIFLESLNGRYVYYDENGKMLKGWNKDHTIYTDETTGEILEENTNK